MKDLYYLTPTEVRTVTYTRDRAMSVSPLFFEHKRDAIAQLKSIITTRVNLDIKRLMALEKELANEKM